MRKSLYAVRDSAMGAFHAPFMSVSDGVAMRSFRDEVNRKDASNMMNQHPEDFELYIVGEYEEDNGELMPHNNGPASGRPARSGVPEAPLPPQIWLGRKGRGNLRRTCRSP